MGVETARGALLLSFCVLGLARAVTAQGSLTPAQAVRLDTVHAGDCRLTVRLDTAAHDVLTSLTVLESGADVAIPLDEKRRTILPNKHEVELNRPVPPQATVIATVLRGSTTVTVQSTASEVVSQWPDNVSCGSINPPDPRPRWSSTVGLGWNVDTFTWQANGSGAVGHAFVAPELSFGLFEWKKGTGGAIWIDTQVVYGAQPAACIDSECGKPPVVGDSLTNVAQAITGEFYYGPRVEFLTLGGTKLFPATRLYAAASFGSVYVLDVSGDDIDDDATVINPTPMDYWRYVAGFRVIDGKFRDTSLEFGLSKNELIVQKAETGFYTFGMNVVYAPGGIASRLSVLQRVWPSTRFFFRAVLDRKDANERATLQTLFGMSYDFSALAGAFTSRGGR